MRRRWSAPDPLHPRANAISREWGDVEVRGLSRSLGVQSSQPPTPTGNKRKQFRNIMDPGLFFGATKLGVSRRWRTAVSLALGTLGRRIRR